MLVGDVPGAEVIVIWLSGLPKLKVVPLTNPVRRTLPTTSVVPFEVAPLGMVSVEAPVVRSPRVRLREPLTERSAPSEMPKARLMVRLPRPLCTAGNVVLAPAPPNVMFELPPPVRLPAPLMIAPLSVSVCAPIDSAPAVSVSAPLSCSSLRVTPAGLLIVRLLNTNEAMSWALLPL